MKIIGRMVVADHEAEIEWKSASRPRIKRFKGAPDKWETELIGTRDGHQFRVLRTLDDAESPEPTEVIMNGKKLQWS